MLHLHATRTMAIDLAGGHRPERRGALGATGRPADSVLDRVPERVECGAAAENLTPGACHPLGSFEPFLATIGPDAGGMRYEASPPDRRLTTASAPRGRGCSVAPIPSRVGVTRVPSRRRCVPDSWLSSRVGHYASSRPGGGEIARRAGGCGRRSRPRAGRLRGRTPRPCRCTSAGCGRGPARP